MCQKKFKLFLLFFTVVLIISLCACSSKGEQESSTISSRLLIVEVDGKRFTIEQAEGKTIEQLMDDAKIPLNKGDVLSVNADVELNDNMVVKVLRLVNITVNDTVKGNKYTAVITGSTVSDALTALDIKLAENQILNHKSDAALKDGMEIVITEKKAPETAEPETDDSEENDNYNNSGSNNSNANTNSRPQAPVATRPAVTNPPVTKPPVTKPPVTQPPTTKAPVPTTSGRTVVSVEVYEDCDGSGHGVKVITYSDGTQEEVQF